MRNDGLEEVERELGKEDGEKRGEARPDGGLEETVERLGQVPEPDVDGEAREKPVHDLVLPRKSIDAAMARARALQRSVVRVRRSTRRSQLTRRALAERWRQCATGKVQFAGKGPGGPPASSRIAVAWNPRVGGGTAGGVDLSSQCVGTADRIRRRVPRGPRAGKVVAPSKRLRASGFGATCAGATSLGASDDEPPAASVGFAGSSHATFRRDEERKSAHGVP